MNKQNYTKEQNELIAEYSAAYGLEPGQIIFFEGDPEPFFDRDATAVLLHSLCDVAGIEDTPVESFFPDVVSVHYKVTFTDGTFAGSTGKAHINELLDGQPMTLDQLNSLATSRAARSALRNKGIKLARLHEASKGGHSNVAQFSGPPISNEAKLLREVHALGYETSYIVDSWFEEADGRRKFTDKAAWKRLLNNRYGVDRSSDLSEDQLADFAAFLRTMLPVQKAAA